MGISQLGPKMATSCRHGIKRVLSYLHTKRLRNTNTFKGAVQWCYSVSRELSSGRSVSRTVFGPSLLLQRMSTTLEAVPSPLVRIEVVDRKGEVESQVIKKSDLAARHHLALRDFRFSTSTSILVREHCTVVGLQHIKAIITAQSVTFLEARGPLMVDFVKELQAHLQTICLDQQDGGAEVLPYEFVVLETMLAKMIAALDARLEELEPAIAETLNGLLDPRLSSIDRGQLHILLHLSKKFSEFQALLDDFTNTLDELAESEDDLIYMYLSHLQQQSCERDPDDIEEIENLLEAYIMQLENMSSRTTQLKHLIDQSESIILINLDSQRNVMLRLSLQLEMGMFAAALCGLVGVAFGMNLKSSLEESPVAFWLVTGMMYLTTGVLWSRLLKFLGKNLEKVSLTGALRRTRKQDTKNVNHVSKLEQ